MSLDLFHTAASLCEQASYCCLGKALFFSENHTAHVNTSGKLPSFRIFKPGAIYSRCIL